MKLISDQCLRETFAAWKVLAEKTQALTQRQMKCIHFTFLQQAQYTCVQIMFTDVVVIKDRS